MLLESVTDYSLKLTTKIKSSCSSQIKQTILDVDDLPPPHYQSVIKCLILIKWNEVYEDTWFLKMNGLIFENKLWDLAYK